MKERYSTVTDEGACLFLLKVVPENTENSNIPRRKQQVVHFSRALRKYFKDHKHNNLHLALIYARIFILGHICSSKLTGFLELRSQKGVRIMEQIMSLSKWRSVAEFQMKCSKKYTLMRLEIFFLYIQGSLNPNERIHARSFRENELCIFK